MRNSGALSLPAASSSLRCPGCVFCRFSLLRFVFWFLLPPLVPPICLFLVLPWSGVILSRCLVACPGFVIFVNGPCVLTGAPLWLRRPYLGYPVFQALLFRCSACLPDVLAFRRLPISLLRFAPPVLSLRFFVTDLFLGLARAFGCCCSGVFFFRPFQASCGSVALSCLADYFFVAVYNRPIASAPTSFRFRVPGRGISVFLSSFWLPSSVAPLPLWRIAGFFFFSLPFWLFPPVCVAPLVLPAGFSVSFSLLRYPVSSLSFRRGSCRSLRLPDSAFPVFATMHLPRNVAPPRLLGCVAHLLSFPSRFPVIFGWLRLSCLCCSLSLLYLLLHFPSSRLYCVAATSRLFLRRFVSPASSGFAAPFRFPDCVAPLRLFGRYSVSVFGTLRARLELEILSALRAAGAIHPTCAQLTPSF